jgi:hypothetical protein
MDREEIQQMIDDAIKHPEIRVGWISGVIGALFTFGIIHAIWLIQQ